MLEEQRRLNEWLLTLNVYNLPQCFMLLGESGCGKHTLAQEIADKLFIEYLDITEEIDNDLLNALSFRQIPTLYVIHIDEIVEKNQNILLKFIEEPKMSKYVCIICDNVNLVIPTVKNRCLIYTFETYSKEILNKYITEYFDSDNRNLALEIFTTIGQIKSLKGQNLVQLKELCDKMLTKIGKANIQNTLTIADKLNYKDLYDKYDINLFFKMLEKECLEYCKSDNKYVDYYKIIQSYWVKLNRDSRLKKQDLIENFLINLWKKSREV